MDLMSLQRMIVRTLLKLPDGLLVKMSGGKPLEIDGRTLDARVQLLASQGAKAPSMTTLPIEEARKGADDGLAMLDAKPRRNVSILSRSIPGPEGELHVRVYTPAGATGPLPGIVYYHMGGCVIGGLETCNTFCSILAEDCRAIVVSVDYRLAPEHKFPAAIDDAIASYDWVYQNATALGIDNTRLGLGGDSAGGWLSAVVCQHRKREGLPQPKAQLLIYPATDLQMTGGSMESCKDVYPLTREIMDWFMAQFLTSDADRSDWRGSPGQTADLSGLAPAIVATAGFDVLRDQGEAYANKLKAAGVPASYHCYDSLAHAFTAFSGTVPAAKQACEELAREMAKALNA
ncbi:MAG: alpha/beta hydrolase [Alphaproteobacteria bacterium]|jgi:acetyl esterase/lipase|nr:alpha/beta hydrolase fold carboxyl esterase [uncultured bacterium]MBO6544409.1 alpha/beta hydrolase [Alphaproteobacteria bacterium]MBO6628760.1 alpha/beta hydrolase [Alphaproteobacteria bacterium]